MFLSLLPVDVGNDPDRPRPGRLWLRNVYHVHQRLCMAFPSAARKSDDPQFLKPYNADDFGSDEPNQVGVQRRVDAGFLFRVDPLSGGRVVIVVQSAVKPDWGYAFANAGHLLAGPPEVSEFDPCAICCKGARWRFRLRANPTKKREEKRHALRTTQEQEDWLRRKAAAGGFEVLAFTASREGSRTALKTDYDLPEPKTHRISFFAVRFEGVLRVVDEQRFLESLCGGIGSAKGLGFGLLSLARVSQ